MQAIMAGIVSIVAEGPGAISRATPFGLDGGRCILPELEARDAIERPGIRVGRYPTTIAQDRSNLAAFILTFTWVRRMAF
jgi:hypothetical protein